MRQLRAVLCVVLGVIAVCVAVGAQSASAGGVPRVAGTHAAVSGVNPLSEPAGTLVSAAPLNRALWVPGAAAGYRVEYVTTDGSGNPALSTGEIFLPAGAAPAGGWPVISWAHGTDGLKEDCQPSVVGPAEPARDFGYLANWIKAGYAIVATDYATVNNSMAYLDGDSEAHNVVDMVKAGRAFAASDLLADEQLSNRWVAIGQSQGGGAAIYTARYATQYGGSSLDYLGAVGTGVPANIEDYITLLGPEAPPASLGADLNAELIYIVAALRDWRPQLGIEGILTAKGKQYVQDAENLCVFTGMTDAVANVSVGDMFTRPLATLPDWTQTIDQYMAMPTSGFDKPFFIGQGLEDTDVPAPPTVAYAAELEANGQPVTFKTYATDHSGTLVQAQADEIPFVANLFTKAGTGPTPQLITRITQMTRPTLAAALRKGVEFKVVADAGKTYIARERIGKVLVGTRRITTPASGQSVFTVRFIGARRAAVRRGRAAGLTLNVAGATLKIALR